MLTNLLLHSKNKIIIVLLFNLTLVGCSSNYDHEKNLSMLVNQRAAEITSALPVQKDNFSLVMARAIPPTTLELVVYSDAHYSQDQDSLFLQRFTRALCLNSSSRALLQHGAQYQIRLRHSSNQESVRVIHYASCPHD